VETIFSLSGLLVMPFWALMIFLPHWRWTRRILRSPLVILPPALLYASLVLPRLAEVFPVVSSPTLAGISSLLGTPDGATIAWAHFLAFDLFVGRWIYLDGYEGGISALLLAPVLFLTLMLGPLGFLLFLVLRVTTAQSSSGSSRPEPSTKGGAGE
jgi:apolipoprotein N-acyltransferase